MFRAAWLLLLATVIAGCTGGSGTPEAPVISVPSPSPTPSPTPSP
jgi:hypothetical protein